MTLEDHVGDIIRKARAGLGVASPPAAAAAGLSVEQLSELESSGRCSARPNYAALAALLKLEPEAIADGWSIGCPDDHCPSCAAALGLETYRRTA